MPKHRIDRLRKRIDTSETQTSQQPGVVVLVLPPTQRLEDRAERPLAVDAREEFASAAREGAVLASDDVLPSGGRRVRHQGVWRAGGRLRGGRGAG